MFLVVVVRLDFDFDVEWTVNGDLMSDVTLQRRHAKLATMTVSVAACRPPGHLFYNAPLSVGGGGGGGGLSRPSAPRPSVRCSLLAA